MDKGGIIDVAGKILIPSAVFVVGLVWKYHTERTERLRGKIEILLDRVFELTHSLNPNKVKHYREAIVRNDFRSKAEEMRDTAFASMLMAGQINTFIKLYFPSLSDEFHGIANQARDYLSVEDRKPTIDQFREEGSRLHQAFASFRKRVLIESEYLALHLPNRLAVWCNRQADLEKHWKKKHLRG